MHGPRILILTPVHNVSKIFDGYVQALKQLSYNHKLISIGLLEGNSTDGSFELIQKHLPALNDEFESARLWQKNYDFAIPPGTPRWSLELQVMRRTVLAKSRNQLLFRALTDQDWVLWIDADVTEYPSDVIEVLLSQGKNIVQPNTVRIPGGKSYDLNAWRDKGKKYLHDLKSEGDLVPLHSVGGTMLLVNADLHREGLIFPPFLYGKRNRLARRRHNFSTYAGLRRFMEPTFDGEIETEGLAMMAHDMGEQCWGMPNHEIIHSMD